MPLHAVSIHALSMIPFAIVAMVCMAAQSTVAGAAAREGPAALGGSVEPQPVKVKASTRRLVFTCIAPSLVTFSDRPCGPAAAVRELQLRAAIKPEQAIEQAGRAPTVLPEAPRASARDRTPVDASLDVAPATPNDAAATCQRLGAALATLDARMRTGYSAREAGRLWDRWRDAKARLREADC